MTSPRRHVRSWLRCGPSLQYRPASECPARNLQSDERSSPGAAGFGRSAAAFSNDGGQPFTRKEHHESTIIADRLRARPVVVDADARQQRRRGARRSTSVPAASRSTGTAVRRRALRRRRARLSCVLRPAAWRDWAATAARAPTATWRRTISSSRRPMSRHRFQLPAAAARAIIRTPTIRCSGRSTRMTSGPTATTPATSATFARTAWSGSRSRCRRTSG